MKRPRIPLVQALFDLAGRERRALLAEFVKSKGLMLLRMKPRNGERWSSDDRGKILAHLRRLSRLSPYLVILLLPGGVLLVPLLAWWLDRRRRPRDGPAGHAGDVGGLRSSNRSQS